MREGKNYRVIVGDAIRFMEDCLVSFASEKMLPLPATYVLCGVETNFGLIYFYL